MPHRPISYGTGSLSNHFHVLEWLHPIDRALNFQTVILYAIAYPSKTRFVQMYQMLRGGIIGVTFKTVLYGVRSFDTATAEQTIHQTGKVFRRKKSGRTSTEV